MSSHQTFQLQIIARGPTARFAHLTLFNGHKEVVAKGYGELNLRLPKGIYQLQTEFNENLKTEFIQLDEHIANKFVEVPHTDSSLLGEQYGSSHEYYTSNVNQYSMQPTMPVNEQIGGESSIFLFFRFPNKELYQETHRHKSLGEDFVLLNGDREIVYELKNDVIKEDLELGWLALHAELPSGQYYLVYNGGMPREIPVVLFDNWQTQLFITFRKGPIFSTLRISLERKGKGFNPESQGFSYAIDAIIQKLHNGIYYLPDDLLVEIADEKWESPILAILGAYVYLQSKRRDKDNLFRVILANLEEKILRTTCPDIEALKVLFALHNNQEVPNIEFSEPCMLVAGMKAIVQASYQNELIVAENSITEQVIDRLYDDSVWTSYVPLSITKMHQTSNPDSISDNQLKEVEPLLDEEILEHPDSWVVTALIEKLGEQKPRKRGWKPKQSEMKLSAIEMARELRITPRVLKGVIQNVLKQKLKDPTIDKLNNLLKD